jgi:serine/threonine protein kinase
MAIPKTALDFVHCLRKSELLPEEVVHRCELELQTLGIHDAAKIASVYVKRKLLTAYQAKLILSGRYRGFYIGPYVIREEIGKGGMGAVYLAEHTGLRRQVALKVLLADKMHVPGVVDRFLREARAAASLDHPNIVRVFDIVMQGQTYWIVMEYVDGMTIDRLLQIHHKFPVTVAVRYAAQIAAGLQHAADLRMIHRDIKPANIMVNKQGHIKILDMGLARHCDAQDHLTGRLDRGAILGTADYISPEQAIQGPNVDIRSDLYSLGATLFVMLTGRPPFLGGTMQKLMQHQQTPAPRLTEIDPTLPEELAEIVARLLAKRPEDRYPSPNALIADFAPWLSSNSKLTADFPTSTLPPNSDRETLIGQAENSTNRLPRTTT